MMISVVIPVLNEEEDSLIRTLHYLTTGIHTKDLEVVLVNDGSINSDGSPKLLNSYKFPIRIRRYLSFHENMRRYGVGYSIDRGVAQAQGDAIVIMGADIIPQGEWLYGVRNALKSDELGCACSVGLQPGNYDITEEGLYHRYGATITWTMGHDDLPKNSEYRKDPNYSEIVGCRWASKKSDEPYEIDAVYGAMYWTTREFYQRMHGFDTIEGEQFRGHRMWGHLESMLSLKTRVYGGKCVVYPDIKAGHIFGRIGDINKVRSVRADWHYWNRLWIAHTMLDDPLKEECLNHLKFCKNLSDAQAWIRQNWKAVQEVREYNRVHGKLISA